MKLSREWLNEYVDLEGLSVEALSHALTMVGFEVEGVEQIGLPPLENIVAGEIRAFAQHPNADRLSVCQVDVGDGTERTIVCGAKNFSAGDRVIVALPGAVLPGDFKIKQSKLRGVVSEGMLCSERELGLGEDHSGIAILRERPELGTAVNALYPHSDVVFDVEVTPNRPDALSHLGIARELGAWFKRPLRYPEITLNLGELVAGTLVKTVRIDAETRCPHYRGYNVRGVTIGESPDWLKRRLTAVGLRPINNVVDATNYVLLETGQPLHAFDAGKIRGDRIVVRMAREGETLTTLDDKARTLTAADLVIADAERPLVVAGVMGSVDAEVDAGTRDLMLEAAYFTPVGIRRSSRRLGLTTDSSYRFERGVDPKGAEYAALRCLDLIQRLAGGEVLGPVLVAGEPPLVEKEIAIAPDYVRERLGFEVSDAEIADIFERLELWVVVDEDAEGGVVYRVAIPSYRGDLYRRMDLVEEVIRIYGSDKIPAGAVRARATLREDDPVPVYLRAASEILVGQGFEETVHYTLRDGEEVRRWYGHEQGDNLRIANPLASDASHLRASLIPGLLDCIKLNNGRHNRVERLFETGRVFRERDGRIVEMVSVGFVIQVLEGGQWLERTQPDYYTAQGLVLELARASGICAPQPSDIRAIREENAWQEGHAGQLGGPEQGWEAKFGLLNLNVSRSWDIGQPVLAGAFYFEPERLVGGRGRARYAPLRLYPPALRDLAVVVDKAVPAGRILVQLAEIAGPLAEKAGFALEQLRPFDVYCGEGLPEGTQSLAFEFTFGSGERTLTDKEVNEVFTAIQAAVGRSEGLRVRG